MPIDTERASGLFLGVEPIATVMHRHELNLSAGDDKDDKGDSRDDGGKDDSGKDDSEKDSGDDSRDRGDTKDDSGDDSRDDR